MRLTPTELDAAARELADPPAKKRFCSRCGEPAIAPPAGSEPPFEPRVCAVCGMGVLLRCPPDALPGAGGAFLIVDRTLAVTAVSEAAEAIFGPEELVIGTKVTGLLTSTLGERAFARTVTRASLRVHDAVTMPTRLIGERAGAVGTMACRIATCGPPRAALLAVEPTHFGRA